MILCIKVEFFCPKVCADEKEQRKDLYVIATSYLGQLKARKSQNQVRKTVHERQWDENNLLIY